MNVIAAGLLILGTLLLWLHLRYWCRQYDRFCANLSTGHASGADYFEFELETGRKKKELRCVFRTDGITPTRRWITSADLGFVNRVWREQTTRSVKEPALNDEKDLERYKREAWGNDEKRSWPNPAMLAVPVVLKPGAEPIGVFLVEALGMEIEPNGCEWDASICCMLLED